MDDAGFFEKVRKGYESTDEERLSRIDDAYDRAGLGAKLSKRQRNLTEATLWGTESNGSRGWSSAPRPFILRLIWLTCKLGRRRVTALGLLRSVLGLWAYVLVFRRPGFCLLSAVYRNVERAKQRWRRENGALGRPEVEPPFEAPLLLSRASCLKLLGLVLLAASWGSDMRAEYPDVLYASDVSP